ncbi:hypothetical protein GQ464_003105 [Rhodocaloribacter litoris]|uniref:DUF6576 domain-containing protein n=1 Tax=Rhodocaloribacter litoris TaxID=2558931 RepID=UPI001422E8DA|nr:DUF6576 domain-containing protein [Rhodocaloribacter litoris]QXD15953.1 hypothetical protein GQ464_003105 [Rhodocaloribacter litoris]
MNLLLLHAHAAATACERCFGAAADSPVVVAIGLSMLALLVLVIIVWGGIIGFFSHVEKRSRMLASGELVVTEDGRVVPAAARANLDDLLDKINHDGYESLSPAEKARLHELATP